MPRVTTTRLAIALVASVSALGLTVPASSATTTPKPTATSSVKCVEGENGWIVTVDGKEIDATKRGWFQKIFDWLTVYFSDKPGAQPIPCDPADTVTLQVLSFNDYHGHLEATDRPLPASQDPTQTPVGGAEYLATKLAQLRDGKKHSVTVAAGDLIGGSTFLSGLFHDEPAIETLNTMGLDVAGVGNHEFDEGTEELQRIVNGGCHPKDGCYFPEAPYAGTDFEYLAANVVTKDSNQPMLPPVTVKEYDGVKVGVIGMTLEATPTLVNPAGVSSVDFTDEIETANKYAEQLAAQGVNTIIVTLHEGGMQSAGYNECQEMSGPIMEIAQKTSPLVDMFVTGHTHQPYICSIADPDGNGRMVTSAASYGRLVTETTLVIDKESGDVVRPRVTSTNHLVDRTTADANQTQILDKWKKLADPLAGRVVGTIAEDVTGDSGGDRSIETPMADLIADAILFGTGKPEDGGAQIAFMNVGGVRASFEADTITNGEKPGEITYAEAYATSPFGNLLVSMDLTGQQIKDVLEQQYVEDRSRQKLALGVSEGFTYTWDDSAEAGSKVVADTMTLNGEKMSLDATYRVSTLNFLADGGDSFTGFTKGANILGGPEDLANLVAFLEANPGITPPADRVAGL